MKKKLVVVYLTEVEREDYFKLNSYIKNTRRRAMLLF